MLTDPPLAVDLALEVPGVLLAVRIAVARTPLAIVALRCFSAVVGGLSPTPARGHFSAYDRSLSESFPPGWLLMSAKAERPPAGLAASGEALWGSVLKDYELEQHERIQLLEAFRSVDALDRLAVIVARDGDLVVSPQGDRVHPATVEAR